MQVLSKIGQCFLLKVIQRGQMNRRLFPAHSLFISVADSNPAAEYEETLAKARGFLAALETCRRRREESLT